MQVGFKGAIITPSNQEIKFLKRNHGSDNSLIIDEIHGQNAYNFIHNPKLEKKAAREATNKNIPFVHIRTKDYDGLPDAALKMAAALSAKILDIKDS